MCAIFFLVNHSVFSQAPCSSVSWGENRTVGQRVLAMDRDRTPRRALRPTFPQPPRSWSREGLPSRPALFQGANQLSWMQQARPIGVQNVTPPKVTLPQQMHWNPVGGLAVMHRREEGFAPPTPPIQSGGLAPVRPFPSPSLSHVTTPQSPPKSFPQSLCIQHNTWTLDMLPICNCTDGSSRRIGVTESKLQAALWMPFRCRLCCTRAVIAVIATGFVTLLPCGVP